MSDDTPLPPSEWPGRVALALAWIASVAGAALWTWGLGYDVSAEERHEAKIAHELATECLALGVDAVSAGERAAGMMRGRPAVEWMAQRTEER